MNSPVPVSEGCLVYLSDIFTVSVGKLVTMRNQATTKQNLSGYKEYLRIFKLCFMVCFKKHNFYNTFRHGLKA